MPAADDAREVRDIYARSHTDRAAKVPLASRFVQAAGWSLHVRTGTVRPARPAPPLVVVHGLVISSLYMVPTAVRLAQFHPVYAPDLPGFGKSDKPARTLSIAELADALLACLDALSLERPVLVANSLGCQVSVDLAARYPGRVRALVLAGPTMDRHARSAPRQIGRWLADWTREPLSLGMAHLRDYREAGLRRAWRTFRHALADPIETKLHRVRVPALVVRGSKDRIAPHAWAVEMAGRLPYGELREIPGGPHVVNYTTPLEFARIVLGFVRTLHGTRLDAEGTVQAEG
jgi:2-hydroxy-6-oxonona-2,4-dienedioate hydrolase